jgi:ribonuclease HI
MKAILFTDGGSRGNPGHAGTGSILFNEKMELIDFVSKAYNLLTNNQAEYYALIDGLELAINNNVTDLTCNLDSELIVRQINGIYKIKDQKIKDLIPKIKELCNNFKNITVQHIPREKNLFADRLVNLTLDAYEKQ